MAKSPKDTDIEADLVRKLAGLLDETGLTEIEFGSETGWSIRVAKGGTAQPFVAAPTTAAAPATASVAATDPNGSPAPVDIANHPGVVKSPMVGVVYLSPDPDSPPFVNVGDKVAKGDTLLLIEAMKTFNPITAPIAGTVTQILVETGTAVEFGEPLLVIE